jgi:guanylate kinase
VGNLIVLSAPSGTGKSSLVKRLVRRVPGLVFSISATTRAPREGERDGVDYHFVDVARFGEMQERGDLLEHAEVHGNMYGTPREPTERERAAGRDVLLEIDVQGARSVLAADPAARLVFILPPSRQELEARIRRRGLDSAESIERRLRNAVQEVAEAGRFHHVVINQDIEEAADALVSIVTALRHTPAAQRRRIDAVLESFALPPLERGEGWR